MSLRVVFMGTPDFSVPALEAILAAGHTVVAVYSQPPRPAGRGMKQTKSPVQRRAEAADIAVLTPLSLKTEAAEADFRAHDADVAIVVAYGLILPKAILDAPRHGCLNIHASLLPRWRGAAPINRAIMAGDRTTGVTIMKMDAGLDTGPVTRDAAGPLCETMPIGENETAGALHDRLSAAGARLIIRALDAAAGGGMDFDPQEDAGITYAGKIDKGETRIDWSGEAETVHNHIRGLSPFPGAWCLLPFGDKTDRVKILGAEKIGGTGLPGKVLDDDLAIACGAGAVRPTLLQRAGKQALTRAAFLRGHAIPAGTQLP